MYLSQLRVLAPTTKSSPTPAGSRGRVHVRTPIGLSPVMRITPDATGSVRPLSGNLVATERCSTAGTPLFDLGSRPSSVAYPLGLRPVTSHINCTTIPSVPNHELSVVQGSNVELLPQKTVSDTARFRVYDSTQQSNHGPQLQFFSLKDKPLSPPAESHSLVKRGTLLRGRPSPSISVRERVDCLPNFLIALRSLAGSPSPRLTWFMLGRHKACWPWH
jgi:hypothetical protein